MKHEILKQETVFDALQSFYKESSKRTLQNWIKAGRVAINGKKIERKDAILEPGQILVLNPSMRPQFRGIRYLYYDRHMIVIEKPCGLLSVATENPNVENALQFVRADFQSETIYPVHRLDRECSGVLLFARGIEAQNRFDALFEAHDLTREYLAIVEGRVSLSKGTWSSYLYEKSNFDVVETSPAQGKLAITHYEKIRHSKMFTFLKCTLETGRKHQIRVHTKAAGHPIIGDKRYGSFLNPIKRLGLHAHTLSFIHPFTSKSVSFISPPPKSFLTLGIDITSPR